MTQRQVELMELKQRVQRNDYRVDPDVVAEAIVRRILRRALRTQDLSERVLVAPQGLTVRALQRQA
jgi:hypothetical protein